MYNENLLWNVIFHDAYVESLVGENGPALVICDACAASIVRK